MAELRAVESLDTVSEFPINYNHITEAFLRQKTNSFRFTALVKTKAEVRGSGAKWFRQKGTGRARQGEIRNPHLRGGGKVHGARVRYSPVKMNKRTRRSAWLSSLAYHIERGSMFTVESSDVEGMWKTREVARLLDDAEFYGRTVICCGNSSPLMRSAKNLRDVVVLTPERLNVRDVMLAEYMIFTDDALEIVRRMAVAMVGEDGVRRGKLSISSGSLGDSAPVKRDEPASESVEESVEDSQPIDDGVVATIKEADDE